MHRDTRAAYDTENGFCSGGTQAGRLPAVFLSFGACAYPGPAEHLQARLCTLADALRRPEAERPSGSPGTDFEWSKVKVWRRRPDLNRRVEVLQTSALTTWLRRPERSTIEERQWSIKMRVPQGEKDDHLRVDAGPGAFVRW